MKVYHNSRLPEYRNPFGAVSVGTEIYIAIDMSEADIESARLMVWHGETISPHYYEMTEEQPGTGHYSAVFTAPEEPELLWYTFEIKASDHGGNFTVYFGRSRKAFSGEGDFYQASPECWQITVYRTTEVPAWYKDGIVYQIFPDRFARDEDWRERTEAASERVNRRRSDTKRVIEEDWYRPAWYGRDENNNVVEWPMYGGSLKGIEEKLDYIRSLGTTCIYLNPIFEATSNHRYDTGDYMKIESALGTEEDFESLCEAARTRGMHIMLDGVFSHTGSDSIYFDRYGNYSDGESASSGRSAGAWNNPDSPYRSWFKFDDNEPYGYSSWWGTEDLPEVDEDVESYRRYMLGEDGVVAHWMEKGASAWRLDVADELPDSFIAETRQRMKSCKPDSVLIGEVWEDASNKISYGERRRYLLGDELDGTMNYPLRDILLDYINYTISSADAADRLMTLEENYPRESFYSALNLIGSHDRQRILTAMAADQDYKSAVRKVKLLSTLQYALPGVPCIYYGDEAGLTGGADPANRSGFPWDQENLDLSYHYRMLGLLYDEHPALAGGEFRMISGQTSHGGETLGSDIFAFVRKGRDAAGTDETILVLANRSYGQTNADLRDIEELRGGYALELLTSKELPLDENGSLGSIHMDRLSVMVISIRDQAPAKEIIGRDCGVICHISSLGTPTLGRPARDFVDYLESAGIGIWQVLPLNPAGLGNSPYSSSAAFAGEPSFINKEELPTVNIESDAPGSCVKDPGNENDSDSFSSDQGSAMSFGRFCENNAYWLDNYVAYTVTKESQDQKPWYEWPDDLKFASAADILGSLTPEQQKHADELRKEQYSFAVQWADLKAYANSKGIRLMGDLPMFMAADSADVWANKDIFRMDDFGRQKVHAGVPPDAFTGLGQDWGNPLYDWDKIKETGYDWWMKRMRQCAERFDVLRIDHFRGFSEYFAIPEGTGPHYGKWQHGPGIGFISALQRMLEDEGLGMKLLAEDLGYLDAGVKNLLKFSGLPGMDIWQFNAPEMMQKCENEPEKAECRAFYTGTHDNDTLAGWVVSSSPEYTRFRQEAAQAALMTVPAETPQQSSEAAEASQQSSEPVRTPQILRSNLPDEVKAETMRIIREIYESPACLAMMQLQDVLMLGSDARMNVPGIAEGNWHWKLPEGRIEECCPDAAESAAFLRELAERTGRR